MEDDILSQADHIVSDLIKTRDPYEKVAMILKIIPVESFDEAFRFFPQEDRKILLKALEEPFSVSSVETKLVIEDFIKRNDLARFLKTATLKSEETIDAFQKYTAKNPRKISQMLYDTWLNK